MNAERTCPKCGVALPADAPQGLCPQCLIKGGLEPSLASAVPAEPAAKGGPGQAGTIELKLPPVEQPGDWIGRYRLLQKIGEGGFGAVYMAEQQEPVRRRVALKIVKLGMDTKQVIARFEAERQALALMDHPNIAKVFDAGATETGRPFFVMELVRGIKITDYCDQNNLTTAERLALFKQICHAIQHAHQKGIIHRDLKPSNILVTLHDGTPVPKVIDFGVAKATQQQLTDKTLFTAFEQVIGTPAYMSPEQAELSGLDIDTRSDIYSLGVLLYELLTGRPPFDPKELMRAGLNEMRRIIREKEPPRPSTRLSTLDDADLTQVARHRHAEAPKLISLIRGDLDWIVMKALEKDRTRRYETANGLAHDIQRHLDNEPVNARPPSRTYRLQKMVRRNKLAVSAVAAVAAALIVGLGVSTWSFVRERHARQRAVAAEREQSRLRQEAEKARGEEAAQRQKVQEKSQQLAETLSQLEQQKINEVVSKESSAKGLAYLARTLRRNPDNHRAAYRLLSLLSHQSVARLVSQKKYEGQVRDVCYGSLGPLILTSTGDRDLQLWDYRQTQPLAGPLRHDSPLWGAEFSPSGQKFLVPLTNGILEVWHVTNTAAPACVLVLNRQPGSTLFSADEARAVTSGPAEGGDYRTRVVQVWDLVGGKPLTKPVRYDSQGYGANVTFTPDGKQVVLTEFAGNKRTRSTLDVATGTLSPKQETSNIPYPGEVGVVIRRHAFLDSQQGTLNVATGLLGLADNPNVLFPLGSVMERAEYGEQPVVTVPTHGLSLDAQQLLTLSRDNTISLWDVGFRAVIPARITLSREHLTAQYPSSQRPYLELSADGQRLLLLDPRATAKVCDARTGGVLAAPLAEPGQVALARLSPDGAQVAVALTNGWLRLWSASNGQPLTPPFADTPLVPATNRVAGPSHLAFSPDGRRLAVTWRDGVAQVWDARTGKLLTEFQAHPGAARQAVFSPDGERLATLGPDRVARVWNATTGAALTPPLKHDGLVISCQFSPDGRWLATGSEDKTARLWDAATGQLKLAPFKHDGQVNTVALPPPGTLLITASGSTVRAWDVQSGALVQSINLGNVVFYTTFREGRFILAQDYEGLRVWDITTGTPLSGTMRPMSGSMSIDQGQRVALNTNGHRLAFVLGDTVAVWELPLPVGPVPDWLPRLAEALAAQRLNEQGLTERVAPGEYLTLRQTILASGAEDPYQRWARWFFADRASLTIAPSSPLTVADHVRRCLEANTASSLQEALSLDPGNVQALAAHLKITGGGIAAGVEPLVYPGRSEEDLKRQVRSQAAQAEALADRLLAAIPDSSIGWQVKAGALHQLDQNEAALQALERVNAAEWGVGYWSVRGRVLEQLARTNEAYQAFTRAIELAQAQSPQAASFHYGQRAGFLRRQNRMPEAVRDSCVARGIPLRDPAAKPNLLDLSLCYTGSLTNFEAFIVPAALSDLPMGVHQFGGTEFDVRGLISGPQYSSPLRRPLASIPVNQRARALHFLQSAASAIQATAGGPVGQYTVHYANGQTQEIPVRIGHHLWDWFYYDNQPLTTEAPLAWVGLSERARSIQSFVRLFNMSWVNPSPDVEIQNVDVELVNNMGVIPFLVAVTADLADGEAHAGSAAAAVDKDAVARQTLETLDQAIARNPQYLPLVRAKATMLERLNRPQAALDLFSRLIAEGQAKGGSVSNYAAFVGPKASLLERLSRTNDALSLLTQVIAKAEAEGDAVTNVMNAALLSRSGLLRRMERPAEAQADWLRVKRIPARDKQAKPNLIDLSPWYNTALTENWHTGDQGHSLTNLPTGIQSFNGIAFDVRGAIHLSGIQLARYRSDYPQRVDAIPLGSKLGRLHVLHAASWSVPDGTEIGHFILHYADGQEEKIPIRYGLEVRDWWFGLEDGPATAALKPAWVGGNSLASQRAAGLRLFVSSWPNPRPQAALSTLDYVSAGTDSAPFLVAITTEP
jgi:serine/threonine protein kinase/WD40 repeat protein/tetratricopeptide (TPR) repeat protein